MNEMYKIISFLTLLLSVMSCHAQTTYAELANDVDKKRLNSFFQKRDQLLNDGVELSSFLPQSHSKNGDVDYTKELQIGIDKGGVLLFPNYPLLINKNGLNIKSGTKLVFRERSKLIMKSNSETHYTVLDIKGVKNVDVYFANIDGDRDRHLIPKGEWGMGIRIQGSQNINLYASTITNCWGDGIYIGPLGKIESESILIHNFKIHRARRNGISIISGRNLTLNTGVISETFGTAPQSGLDIEPNRSTNVLSNIIIKNLITHNSAGDGIMMALSNLTVEDGKLSQSIGKKMVTIRVENHKDIGSGYAARINGRDENSSKSRYKKGKLGGEIAFVNPVWIGYKDNSPVRYSPKKTRVLTYGFNPNVSFSNITLQNGRGNGKEDVKGLINAIIKDSKKL